MYRFNQEPTIGFQHSYSTQDLILTDIYWVFYLFTGCGHMESYFATLWYTNDTNAPGYYVGMAVQIVYGFLSVEGKFIRLKVNLKRNRHWLRNRPTKESHFLHYPPLVGHCCDCCHCCDLIICAYVLGNNWFTNDEIHVWMLLMKR